MPYAKALGLTVTSVVGGMSFNRQATELQRGVDLLVATPGRLTDHINQRTCDLSAIEVTAIDEADRMADMGFLPQVTRHPRPARRRTASGCCSPRRWTATSTRWSAATCTTR